MAKALLAWPAWGICLWVAALLGAATFAGTDQVEPKGLHCMDRGAQVEIVLRNSSDGVDFLAWSARGIDGWPLYQGVVTKDVLKFLEFELEDLKNLPWHVELHWPKKSCKINADGPFFAECFGTATPRLDFPYESNSLVIYRVNEKSPSGDYNSYRLSWGLTTESTTYFLGFSFYDPLCSPL